MARRIALCIFARRALYRLRPSAYTLKFPRGNFGELNSEWFMGFLRINFCLWCLQSNTEYWDRDDILIFMKHAYHAIHPISILIWTYSSSRNERENHPRKYEFPLITTPDIRFLIVTQLPRQIHTSVRSSLRVHCQHIKPRSHYHHHYRFP